MIDIEDTTFIIPVRIESNDRYRNLFLSVGYLLKNTNAKIIIMESDEEQFVPKTLERVFVNKTQNEKETLLKRIQYIFDYSTENMFHRTRLLNLMVMETKTPIVVNYDCDVVLPLDSYEKASQMCREDYDLVYPYSFGDGAQLRVVLNSNDITDFENTSDLKILKGFPWRAEYGFCQFFKTQSYINGFLENENFLAYGPEDCERAYRWQKLDYKIGRVNNLVYHFEHSRTLNSNSTNPFMKSNEALYEKLRNMTKEDLINYYQHQDYYQKRKNK